MTLGSLRPWLILRAQPGMGDITLCRLVAAFGSPASVLGASRNALMAVGGLSADGAEVVRRPPEAETLREIDRELMALERLHLRVVTILDDGYPALLRRIADPPPLLYVGGRLEPADALAVAVVGSRRATPAGRAFTEELSRDLAARGFTIVSGLARGVDAAAHRGALAADGRTLAVLGCGLDRVYPSEHRTLRQQIEQHGAVIGELPLGAPPHGAHFPRRNRIISGLSIGVVVTEAARDSGSLITARLALEQGREVFAVPGFVKAETSRGPHSLIKQGAKLVESAADIIEELLPQLDDAQRARLIPGGTSRSTGIPLAAEEAVLYALLSFEPMHVDRLIATSGLPAADVSRVLLALELKRRVRQVPGQSYLRV